MINPSHTKSRRLEAFLLALAIGVLVFLPFVIRDGGYFIYYGDFNVQQIPFYQLAHRAVRSGDIWWSWYTDLGANFFGSYSFYLLFSPFFWLTLFFPNSWLPFLMAPLLVLKTACASLTAYLYLERFVRDKGYAVIGALLYAFSGWMNFNIFFNHFHEVAVFFPLLLLGIEQLVTEDKGGWFALAVFVNAAVNYWFFVGETVFCILYVVVRMTDPSWGMTARKFGRLAFEAVLGVGCAAVVLVPSVLAILGNPRTGTSELLTGWNFWLYWHEQRYPAIVQALFFPPEPPARPNFLPDHGAKWASLSGWLPLFGMTGVLAYFFGRGRDWLQKILALCLVFAVIPGLNSLFILLNHSYYARWFYMPVLLMGLATARALEDSAHTVKHFRRGVFWSAVVVAVIAVMSGLTPNYRDGELHFGMAQYPAIMWIYTGFAAACLVLTGFLVLGLRGHKRFRQLAAGCVALVSVVFLIFYIQNGRGESDRTTFVVGTAIKGSEYIYLPAEPFARTDVYDDLDNLAMFWKLPNIQAFHSIVPPSIMDFYPTVGVTRDVGSRPEAEHYALRPLLSVRWLFISMDKGEQSPMPGYTWYADMGNYHVYENDNYIPMGFGYTQYITRSQLEQLPVEQRGHMLLRAMVLEDDDAWKHIDLLTPAYISEEMVFTADTMAQDAAERAAQAADSFSRDKGGFTAATSYGEETMVFFSVPWEAGWTASIDGRPVEIQRVNLGFVGVRVPAGAHQIRFDYQTPGLHKGAAISGVFLAVFLTYLLLTLRRRRRAAQALALRREEHAATAWDTAELSWAEYLERYHNKARRRRELQQVLNQASARHLDAQNTPPPQEFHFQTEQQSESKEKQNE